ncbi:hypothetical protein BKA67DRAFT_538100 [Truncatella angustata]|uniref:Xaa-Pro dipeptidyl-peptidase-like domain-containing protein n=1 Tax=Truncatella angustata TaxID=152316 RepID=A0A9P8UHL7_9PEZI|nr:uncharacterized protein BKA67DRAFT_538100 [Truncatella angustata]KAH6652280.1 hypothetical protein BKA67DRAFT_538100 [Truncatella angustata]
MLALDFASGLVDLSFNQLCERRDFMNEDIKQEKSINQLWTSQALEHRMTLYHLFCQFMLIARLCLATVSRLRWERHDVARVPSCGVEHSGAIQVCSVLSRSNLICSNIMTRPGFLCPSVLLSGLKDKASCPHDGFNLSTTVLHKWYRRKDPTRPFDADTVFEKDVVLPMRDGVKLYCDVFRPIGDEKVPAIIIWSPYCKLGTGQYATGLHGLYMIPGRLGSLGNRSAVMKINIKRLDPAVRPARGHAIVDVELRVSWGSEVFRGVIVAVGSNSLRYWTGDPIMWH